MNTNKAVTNKRCKNSRTTFTVIDGNERKSSRTKQEQKCSSVPTMLTVRELSEKTGISSFSIRQMIRDGRVVYIKLGKKVLINYEKFVEYLETGER